MGTNLKKIREKRGLSQKQLADSIGKSDKTVSAYEQEGRAIPRDFLEEAARVLKVSLEEILGDDVLTLKESGPYFQVNFQPDALTHSQLRQLLNESIRDLPDDESPKTIQMLQNIRVLSQALEKKVAESMSLSDKHRQISSKKNQEDQIADAIVDDDDDDEKPPRGRGTK